MNKNYQQLFRDIVTILRRDYAGRDFMGDRFSPRYYTQAIGQAWNDSRLDDLLFLRFVNQMLACIGDRNLLLTQRPNENYIPWSPGFYTRRFEDELCVTAVTGETRLTPGDRIRAINGGSPAKHKALIQKDFFRGSVPEREDWNGLLKMADEITVLHRDGREETLPLRHHPPAPPALTPTLAQWDGGAVYLRPGPFDPGADTAAFLAAHDKALQNARALILDLRNARGTEEDEIYPLLPWLCRKDTPLRDLLDDSAVANHSRLNCILKAAALGDGPEEKAAVSQLASLADTGFSPVTWDFEGAILPGRGPETVVVLIDTWCRDAGETLALAARRAGAHLLGRPTLGTTDTLAPVSYELDERYILTWPTALSPAAFKGESRPGLGIQPAQYIPWTPEECHRDLLLEAARTYIKEKIN